MFGIGTGELVVLALVAILLFGKDDLHGTLRKVMKGWADFKKVTTDAQNSWQDVKSHVHREIVEFEHQIRESLPTEDEIKAQLPSENDIKAIIEKPAEEPVSREDVSTQLLENEKSSDVHSASHLEPTSADSQQLSLSEPHKDEAASEPSEINQSSPSLTKVTDPEVIPVPAQKP